MNNSSIEAMLKDRIKDPEHDKKVNDAFKNALQQALKEVANG